MRWALPVACGALALLAHLVHRALLEAAAPDVQPLDVALLLAQGSASGQPFAAGPLWQELLSLGVGATTAVSLAAAALTTALAAALAGRWHSRLAAVCAGLAVALAPPLVHYGALPLAVAPAGLLLLASAALVPVRGAAGWFARQAAVCPGNPSGPDAGVVAAPLHALRWWCAGACAALAAAFAPALLVCVAALVALPLCLRRGRGLGRPLARVGAAMGGAALVLLPWAASSHARCGEVLLAPAAGLASWSGQQPGADGSFVPPVGHDLCFDPLGRTLLSQRLGRSLGWREASQEWRQLALRRALAEPGTALALAARKLALWFAPWEAPQHGDGLERSRASAWTLRLPLDASVLLVAALLAPLALRLARGRHASGALAAPLALLAAGACAAMLFFVSGRERALYLPLAAPLAGVTVAALAQVVRQQGLRRALPVGLSALVLLSGVEWAGHGLLAPRVLESGALRWLAQDLERAERADEALVTLQRVLDREDRVEDRLELARALERLGRPREAAAQLRRVLARAPRDAAVWRELGELLRLRLADPRAAQEAYRTALELDGSDAAARFGRGAALLALNEIDSALAELEAALSLAPEAAWRAAAEAALLEARIRALEREGRLTPR